MTRIGVLGDCNLQSETHIATNRCLELVGSSLGIDLRFEWVPTRELAARDLGSFGALIVNTGVYEDRDAVLSALRTAREENIPTLATCGGFQHMIIEFARNVLGLNDVGHAEFDPECGQQIIVPLECSLRGTESTISVVAESQVGQLYRTSEATEKFYCAFGINPAYLEQLFRSPLRVVGTDPAGLVRVTELEGHDFYVGTLFVPQAQALAGRSHPLVNGLVLRAHRRQYPRDSD